MLVDAVVPPMEAFVAGGQVGRQGRRIVVLQGRGVRVELSVFVVREASDFLTNQISNGRRGGNAHLGPFHGLAFPGEPLDGLDVEMKRAAHFGRWTIS